MKLVIALPTESSGLDRLPVVIGKYEGDYIVPLENPRMLTPREEELIRLNQSKLLKASTWATFSILNNRPSSDVNDCAKVAVGTYTRATEGLKSI